MHLVRLVAILAPLSLLLSACKTFDQGTDQEVAIQSFPTGATVVLDGEEVGTTPMTLELPRKISNRIVVKKDGYRAQDVAIAPVRNSAGESYVKFGLLDEAGYYYDLSPNPVSVKLQPDVLPKTRGPDAYTEMTAIIADVDQKRINGEISPVEHKYMVQRIVEFYSN